VIGIREGHAPKFIHSQFPLPMALNSVFSFIKMSDRDLKFVYLILSDRHIPISVSGLPTFLISVKNMNLLSSSIYKHLKTYLIKHKQSLILGECGSQLIYENITLWSSSWRLKFIHSQFPLPMALNSVFGFIKMSDRDLKFVYLFCQTDAFLFVIGIGLVAKFADCIFLSKKIRQI
jgi:hypothetical protein